MRKSWLVIGVAVLLCAYLPAIAQTTSGSIAGSVVDATQSAVANAKVTATEQDKKTTFQTATDASGRFVFPQLAPGRYTNG